MNALVVTMRDARECGLCVRGVKAWFDREGLDFRHFVAHGMPESEAVAMNNAFVNKALERARARREGEKQ